MADDSSSGSSSSVSNPSASSSAATHPSSNANEVAPVPVAVVQPKQLRPDMVTSAISFLRDPKVQSSPPERRIAFLESKGLSREEIDEAMRQANEGSATTGTSVVQATGGEQQPTTRTSYVSQGYPYGPPAQQQPVIMYAPPPPAPPVPPRDWRDYFIMAVVSGGVGYALISLARKYLVPHLSPPTEPVLRTTLDELTAKYDEAAALLSALQEDTTLVKAGVEEQKEKVELAVQQVENALKEVKEGELQREEEMKRISREVDRIKESLPQMIDKTRTAQSQSLSDLQGELRSLKALLLSRTTGGGGATTSSIPVPNSNPSFSPHSLHPGTSGERTPSPGAGGASSSSPLTGMLSGRPTIPAWQLADAPSSTSIPRSPSASDATPSVASNGQKASVEVEEGSGPGPNGGVDGGEASNAKSSANEQQA